jgi:hypothetical protein
MINKIINRAVLIYFISSLAITSYAQDLDSMNLDDLEDSSTLSYRNEATGVIRDDFSVAFDKQRLNFLYHINNDLASLTDIQTLEANYSYKLESVWLELFVMRVSALYSEVFDTTAISLEQGQSSDAIQAFGAGISYQGNWIQDFLDSQRIFTTTSVALGYYTYDNALTVQSYTGFGLKTDIGLHVRQSPKFHYGVKMSYNLAPMTRAAEFDGEPSSARSLTASWLSLALDIAFYF